MKDKVVVKEGGWVWPKIDENSWEWQNQHRDLCDLVMPYVTDRQIMIQAGGNCGFILNTFVPYFDSIYTFEPDPVNFYCLVQNTPASNVIKLQMCLSETSDMLQTEQLVREGRLHDTGGVHVTGNGFTPGIAIDSLALPSCGLIQLDIEGYELKALKGAVNTIEKYKPIVCVELCEKWLNRYHNTSTELTTFMQNRGYNIIHQHGVDVIFAPNNIK